MSLICNKCEATADPQPQVHAAPTETQKVDAEAQRQKEHSEAEALEVTEEIEMAAGILVEDESATARALAENMHGSHPTYAVVILEERIAKRAEEIQMHTAAQASRFERDIADESQRVVEGQTIVHEAAAKISIAYPHLEVPMIVERLKLAVADKLKAAGVPTTTSVAGGDAV